MRRIMFYLEALLALAGFMTIMLAPPFTATWIMTLSLLTTIVCATAWFIQTRLFERWCERAADDDDRA